MHSKPRRLASWIYATLFATVATYHFFVLLDAEMPHAIALRHLVFCMIDAAFAALIWYWPSWLLAPVAALTVEQFWAHAGHVWHAWHAGRIDPPGVFTLGMLMVLTLLAALDGFKRWRA